jgi:hypothetical protein
MCCSVPLLVHGQVSPLLENAHVVAGQWPAGEGVVWPVFCSFCLLRRRCMALEVCERISAVAAVLALDRGLLVVPMRQVGIACGVHFAVTVGLDLDTLDTRAVVVVVLSFDRHVGHCWWKRDVSVNVAF